MRVLRFGLGLVAALGALMAGLPTAAPAQAIAPAQLIYTFAPATSTATTGQLGSYLVLDNLKAPRPSNYNVDFTVSGTAPGACTFHAQGSSDGVNWYNLDGSSAVTCTASGNEFVVQKPVLFLRINIASFTTGDGTTVVTFHYAGGR